MSLQNVDDIEEALNSRTLTARDLYAIWEQRQPVPDPGAKKATGKRESETKQIPWLQDNLRVALQFTLRALKQEEFLLVADAAREILRHWDNDIDEKKHELVKVRMNLAAALTRLGYTRDARRVLEPMVRDDFRTKLSESRKAEILLLLGNIVREESLHATARAVQLRTAEEALEFYKRALELDPEGLDTLALTATMSLILGEPGSALRGHAQKWAKRILELAKGIEKTDGLSVETTRSQATAHAVLEDIDAAAKKYGELSAMDGVTTMDLADARYYAQFLAEALGKPRDLFKKAFPPLQLIVFAGHMPDLPGFPARFPADSIPRVREEIRAKLKELDGRVGLVSAAAGADLLFIEAMRERNGIVHLVLPWSREEFRKTSVEGYESGSGPPTWCPLFERAMAEAATVRAIGQSYVPSSDVGWDYMMEVTAGLALHTARVSRLDVQPLALWDGQPGWGSGGTASFVQFWTNQLHQEPARIDLPAPETTKGRQTNLGQSRRCERSTMQQQVKSMLFADIVGYSKLTEHVIPEFVETFLGRVSLLASSSKHAPRSLNTWGDAVYAIFDFAHQAGCFSLELIQMILEGKNDWLQKGLYWEEHLDGASEPVKHPLNIRIGLHTGPVFVHYDPVVRRLGFTGAHVNRAARIEPVTRPGEVFASEEFAALAELSSEIQRRGGGDGAEEETTGFVSEYAGSMNLAKGFPGRFRIYRVLPKRVFAIEDLAKAAHEFYCEEAMARGETPQTNNSMRPWEELPEDLRDANRAQVSDIPNKLRELGYELAPSYGLSPSEIQMTPEQIEELSIREHDRWAQDRIRHGWTYAPKRDNVRKHHHLLVPWEQLSDAEKKKDRDTVGNLPRLIERAGFRVRKLV